VCLELSLREGTSPVGPREGLEGIGKVTTLSQPVIYDLPAVPLPRKESQAMPQVSHIPGETMSQDEAYALGEVCLARLSLRVQSESDLRLDQIRDSRVQSHLPSPGCGWPCF
jgi:hypothetical protein